MKLHSPFNVLYCILLSFIFIHPVFSQETEDHDKPDEKSRKRYIGRISDQDVILPLISIEWGIPDRWSFTSMYVREFDKDKERKTWHHNLCVTLSPGISGGRLGLGYLNIFDPQSNSAFGLLSQARLVLLRTWGNPLALPPNQTFLGGEIRSSLTGLLNLGMGYYTQISGSEGGKDKLLGFHIGIGI